MRKYEVYADETFLCLRYSLVAAVAAITTYDNRWVGHMLHIRVKP